MPRVRRMAVSGVACGILIVLAGCDRGGSCAPSGPSGAITQASGTLASGEQIVIVVDTPAGTSEVRVSGTFSNLAIRTIDPDCTLPIDQCFSMGPNGTTSGTLSFGSARGHNYNDFAATARFVVRNSQNLPVEYNLTFTPWRPTCT